MVLHPTLHAAQTTGQLKRNAIVFDHADGYCAGVSRLFVAEDRGEVLVVWVGRRIGRR
jgi:hypothetical protein